MKKILLVLFSITFLFACNQSGNKSQSEASADHLQDDSASSLTLNNGVKWKADSITNHNVVNLKTIADNFRTKPFPSMNDYQILSNDLKNGLNQMIQECKMTGPDHEALHHWLNPILKESNQLKNVKDTSEGRLFFKSINEQLDEYHNYFE